MSYPNWPPTVPQSPLMGSWQEVEIYQDPIITEMEGGNKRMRTRPGDDVCRYTFTILMTNAQWATLREWAVVDLARGTKRFRTKIWNGSAMIDAVCQFAAKLKPGTADLKTAVEVDVWRFPGA